MTIGYGNTLITNITNVSAATRYYPAATGDIGIEMAGYTVASIGFVMTGGVTLTIEGCMRKLGADGLTDTWVDITKAFINLNTGVAAAASFVDSNGILQCNGLCIDRIRVKIVTSDAAQSAQVWLRRM